MTAPAFISAPVPEAVTTAPNRNPGCGEFPFAILHVPNIFIQHGLRRNHLAAVDNTAAAYRQNEVHMIFTGQFRAFLYFDISRDLT